VTDDELIALFDSRDETAIEQTAVCYGKRLYQLALRLLHDEGDAEECVNDTFLRVWNAIPPAYPTHLGAYLSQITRRSAFAVLEKREAQKRHAELVSLTDEMAQCLPDRLQEDMACKVEFREKINLFLASLPVSARRVFLRRYWFADSVKEIAARYHISESNVKTSLHRTRKKLCEFLEKEDTV